MHKSNFVVLSAPSGGGKDTIIKKLVSFFPNACRLVTTTTRAMRAEDVSGVNYNFISKKEFAKKIKNNEFLEYNYYNGNYYGIEKNALEKTLAEYNWVFTNIDVNGKVSLDKNHIKHLAIFVKPENMQVLERRIKERGGVAVEDLKKRLKIAKNEIKMSKNYTYTVLNKDGKIDETVAEIIRIIKRLDI